jgi:hypothetical protein
VTHEATARPFKIGKNQLPTTEWFLHQSGIDRLTFFSVTHL